MKLISFLSFFIIASSVFAQGEINQFDTNNKRHGVWKKYHENSRQIRYEGQFKHGKEVGVFKYYCSDCEDQPMVIRTFNESNNIAQVQYFTQKGKLVSEGKMERKNKIGEWLYFQKKSKNIMTREFYEEGKLDGFRKTYYINNKVTQETHYKKGLKEGEENYYSLEGVLLKKLLNVNDQLHGKAYYYDAGGNVIIDGNYKNGKKHGVWKYFKNGKLVLEETYPKPKK
ncbi:MAG: hypothetical protein KUG68_12110 [Flavobacteriaceae bacterium]|nr:hypothetical protein [Flavobacteriaceae bacterium]